MCCEEGQSSCAGCGGASIAPSRRRRHINPAIHGYYIWKPCHVSVSVSSFCYPSRWLWALMCLAHGGRRSLLSARVPKPRNHGGYRYGIIADGWGCTNSTSSARLAVQSGGLQEEGRDQRSRYAFTLFTVYCTVIRTACRPIPGTVVGNRVCPCDLELGTCTYFEVTQLYRTAHLSAMSVVTKDNTRVCAMAITSRLMYL